MEQNNLVYYSGTLIVQTPLATALMPQWGVATVDNELGDLPRPKPTDVCTFMNAVDRGYTIHKFNEKIKHFSYSDYLIYPVYPNGNRSHPLQMCIAELTMSEVLDKRGPDNQGSTVIIYWNIYGRFTGVSRLSGYYGPIDTFACSGYQALLLHRECSVV